MVLIVTSILVSIVGLSILVNVSNMLKGREFNVQLLALIINVVVVAGILFLAAV